MQIAVSVTEYEKINQLPQAYLKAWDHAAKDHFFRGLPWYRVLESTTLNAGDACRIYVAEESDPSQVPKAIFLTRWNPNVRDYFARRLLRGMTGPYSCEFGILNLGTTGNGQGVTRQIAEKLFETQPRWEALRFDTIPKETGELESLAGAFRDTGFLVQPFFHFGNWYENVVGESFESYLAKRPGRLRNTLKRKEKSLSRAGVSRVHVFTQSGEIALGCEAYELVYANSWKTPEPYPQFVPALIKAAAKSGSLRVGILYLDEKPIAAQIWIVSGGRATIFKLAYIEKYKDLSVGSLLTSNMIKRIFEEHQVREIDFGRGDDAYKRDWLSFRRERWGFVAFHPRTLRGLLGATRHLGGYQLRKGWAAIRDG